MTIVVIGALFSWGYGLNKQIKESLKAKTFLPPTQYYSAPKSFFVGMKISPIEFETLLVRFRYNAKPSSEKLRPGQYTILQAQECFTLYQLNPINDAVNCIAFHINETKDPELKNLDLQIALFGKDSLLAAWIGNQTSNVIALEPRLIAQYLDKKPIQQNYLPLGEIPTSCLHGVLAIEDRHFLEHSGVSPFGMARALLTNLIQGRYAQGGSTITQQTVKNYFLTPDRTLKRKVREFAISLILENHSSKDEILETYLNIIYLGQNGPYQIRGFPAAAQHYFGKNIQNLELSECALLAAVLNSPGLYDPFSKAENARKRRDLVLDKMVEYELIRKDEAELAKLSPMPLRHQANLAETAPYYIDAVQKEMVSLSLPLTGTTIFTGLDMEAQATAQKAVFDQLKYLESENKLISKNKTSGKVLEAVLMSANNQSGLIESIVGGRSYKLTQFNRAVDGHRQIGSIMKPFVFLAALEKQKKYHAMSVLSDVRFTFEYQKQKWSPENYGQKYFGQVPMYFALKNSLNAATASLGLEIGLDHIIETARAAGVESKLEKLPSLTLGAFELYPREVLQAYSTLANLGQKKQLRMIRYVTNEFGGVIYKPNEVVQQSLPVLETSQLVSMMKQTIQGGTARSVIANGFLKPAAGKTGTTTDNKDSWFAGFTPYLTTVVWVGYDDNVSHGLTGASGSVPIWTEYMKKQTVHFPDNDFNWPVELEKVKIKKDDDEPKEFELVVPKEVASQFN